MNNVFLFAMTSTFVDAVANVSRRAEQCQKPDIQLQNAIHRHILSADRLNP
jgi:hypothetical protein